MRPDTDSMKPLLLVASLSMLVAIILGAFGAHGLEGKISEEQIASYQTGVLYHLLHSLAILILGLLGLVLKGLPVQWIYRLMLIGIVFFSGSIYLLATSDLTGLPVGFLGPITPLGGSMLIVAWGLLAWNLFNYRSI